jgi:ABC-type molybdate transport system substrate-binding protein
VFRKAEAVRPGSRERLETKALKLVGAADSAVPPEGLGAYAWHLRERRADLFLTYCTNARVAVAELPGAQAVELPPELATGAEYGLTMLAGADAAKAAALALFILSPQGQGILAKHGFDAPPLPQGGSAPGR